MRSFFRWMPFAGALLAVAGASLGYSLTALGQSSAAQSTIAAVRQALTDHDKRVGEMTSGTTALLSGLDGKATQALGDGLLREVKYLKDVTEVYRLTWDLTLAEQGLLQGVGGVTKSEIAIVIKDADDSLRAIEDALRSQQAQRQQYAAELSNAVDYLTKGKPGGASTYGVLKQRLAPAALDREIAVLRAVLSRLNSNLKLI